MKRAILCVLALALLVGIASAARMKSGVHVGISGTTDVTTTGRFFEFTLINDGDNAVDLYFYYGATSSDHSLGDRSARVPSGGTFYSRPDEPVSGYRLVVVSGSTDVYTSYE